MKFHHLAEKPIIVSEMQHPAIKEQSPAPVKQYYRRQLPETCISFCSTEGQEIFKEAITTGHMNCYFRLAAQFRTQDEPAFCGLSTLVMVLNALEVSIQFLSAYSTDFFCKSRQFKNVLIQTNQVFCMYKYLYSYYKVDQSCVRQVSQAYTTLTH